MNLPLTGIAFALVVLFLRVRTPEGSIKSKLRRVDWTYVAISSSARRISLTLLYSGNAIVIVGTTLAIVGLTFGGVRFPWSSVKVLAPLIIGGAVLVAFFVYEKKVPKEPTIPWIILTNRTTVGAYVLLVSLACSRLTGNTSDTLEHLCTD